MSVNARLSWFWRRILIPDLVQRPDVYHPRLPGCLQIDTLAPSRFSRVFGSGEQRKRSVFAGVIFLGVSLLHCQVYHKRERRPRGWRGQTLISAVRAVLDPASASERFLAPFPARRRGFWRLTLSFTLSSASLCLRKNQMLCIRMLERVHQRTGEGGIRTLGSLLGYGALAKRCFRPLSHLTKIWGENIAKNEAFPICNLDLPTTTPHARDSSELPIVD